MEKWSVEQDRPLLREEPAYGMWLIGVLAVAGALATWYLWPRPEEKSVEPATAQATQAESPAAPRAVEPAVRHPLPGPTPAEAKSLPTLDKSDSYLRNALAVLVGKDAFARFFHADRIVRRIVATVDNLPRKVAPVRNLPLEGPRSSFEPGPKNAARYAPYVAIVESLDTRAVMSFYAGAYPLFQRAYEELGYPGQYFNDRLIVAIDDMLAAPELKKPPPLVRPKVLYEYEDEDLEGRSAGQKLLMRMGPANAARVKAKLRELRGELATSRKGG